MLEEFLYVAFVIVVYVIWMISSYLAYKSDEKRKKQRWEMVFVIMFLINGIIAVGYLTADHQRFFVSGFLKEIYGLTNTLIVITIGILALFGGGYVFEYKETRWREKLPRKHKDALRESSNIIKQYQKRFGIPGEWKSGLGEFEEWMRDEIGGDPYEASI